MKMLMKEWKLCMHPMGYIMLLCSALILVPGYPYGVSCFYMGLAIFFICLTARENHDASYTLTLPVSRRDAVTGRILFCTALEVIDLLLIALFILLKQVIGNVPNPAGLDAGVALIGEAMILFALFNLIFFPVYYRDINKPGKALLRRGGHVPVDHPGDRRHLYGTVLPGRAGYAGSAVYERQTAVCLRRAGAVRGRHSAERAEKREAV